MLLYNKVLLINKLKVTLGFDDGVIKSSIISVGDIIGVDYRSENQEYIKGKVKEINCNFNSSIGRVEESIFIKIDGSEEYAGKIAYVKPNSLVNLTIFETSDVVINPVISVDNDEQRIFMVRENEIGIFQYSKDGLIWSSIDETAPGLSAYEVAVKLGFVGTEEEWIASIKGINGKSAYEIAVDKGFIGTEEEWIESLKHNDIKDSVMQQRADIDFMGIMLNIPLFN